MFQVLSNAWALLLGMMLLMVGNGLQGSLLGVRGELEGFSTFQMSVIMAAYFVGFLGGSRMAPEMIRRVGHVRVFAALGSFISAVLILFPALTDPWLWTIGRVIIGFCYSGVYVVAESWLNNAATNETRGQALSLYMITMMIGIVLAQGLLLVADPSGFILFVIPSVLVSISFAPILLSINPTPAFDTTAPMSLRELVNVSPLGAVGMFLLGGVYAAQYGMAAVYGAKIGLSIAQLSMFIASFYVGATFLQYPLGWLSDRMDRRLLILLVSAAGGIGGLAGLFLGGYFPLLIASAVLIGGTANPLYSLLIAYTNDFLEPKDMAAASSGLVFINGVGAIAGPLITGWVMTTVGAQGYFLLIALLLIALAGYAAYRMTQRPSPIHDDNMQYAPVSPSASPLAVEIAQEFAIETQEEDDASANTA
ncbi:Predicted arabinose efflux permease, MFS family [Thalassovita litoralis]|uniref:Predicted arabinose efflux permease, MFS family n=1 Tax=Thalassovita litoralis TaxID=1010611 RepID=A0A521ESI3_9RHOB|nr:MFS transporter [Thalassovita litoralis]SMO86864.1 Predicted arabinose efflux permease, MFS family [Thalassovita litoralis]